MKFPRFYNPFARIRDLEDANFALKRRNRNLKSVNNDQRSQLSRLIREQKAAAVEINELSDNWQRLYGEVVAELDAHEQAVEDFMLEREVLKANIGHRDAIALAFLSNLMGAEQVITANDATLELANQATEELAAEVLELRASAQSQAAETLEVVGFVKACEAALSAAGVVVSDTEEGPRVLVSSSAIIAGLKSGLIGSIPEPLAA